MSTKRIQVVLSGQLVKEIDPLVGTRRRSSFLTEAAEEKLMRMRQIKALDQLVPWKYKDHPELKQGAAKWVSKMRRQDEQRYKAWSSLLSFQQSREAGIKKQPSRRPV